MTRSSLLAFGLAAVASGVADAQVVQETRTVQAPDGAITQTTTTAPALPVGESRRISQILGSNVALQGSPNFGRVEDVVVGPERRDQPRGRRQRRPLCDAALERGELQLRPAGRHLQRHAPGDPAALLRANAWPNMSDQVYASRMNQVFPNAGVVNRAALRPVEGAVPGVVGGPVVDEKQKVKPNGTVKVKDRVR